MSQASAFWQLKTLQQMTTQEWESLCDQCAYCCLHKLEDEDTNAIYLTNIACEFLNLESCRCSDYSNRLQQASMCAQITAENIGQLSWLPKSCAYRCLHEGRPLPKWHPLLLAEQASENQLSVRGFAQSERHIHPDEWQDHIVKKL